MAYSKIEQMALWLLERGESMTARQIIAAGFEFEDHHPVSIAKVGSVLTCITSRPRYVTSKTYINDCGRRMLSLQVREVKPVINSKPLERGDLWRHLLTRKPCKEVAHG